jgi:phosphatidylinositol dimannoside acyltransferase
MSVLQRIRRLVPDLRHDSEFWRKAARFGAVHGPDAFVRYSPPLIGWGWALALPSFRKRVAQSLRLAGGTGSPLEVARVFSTYALSLTESFAIGSGRNERLRARIIGDASFQAARALGRGVIVATAHTSGWYAAGPILSSVYEDDILVVMQHERDGRAESVQQEARDKLGLKVVFAGEDPLAAMPLLVHLRRGGIVALQMDRVPEGQRGIEVSLAGAPFVIPEGPIQLAGASGAAIVVVLGRRVGFLDYEMRVGQMVNVPRRPSREAVSAAAREIAAQIETFVREHPTDWFHFSAVPR